jgi:hypothetical protein
MKRLLLKKDGSARPSSKTAGMESKLMRFSVGYQISRKEFPGYGSFHGTIMSFDGEH